MRNEGSEGIEAVDCFGANDVNIVGMALRGLGADGLEDRITFREILEDASEFYVFRNASMRVALPLVIARLLARVRIVSMRKENAAKGHV
jgi:hypothetical protein